MASEALQEALAERALAEIPKLLTLLDRTPVSPTYGCFDRAYWHYRISDFPCGMSQEFVLPLALAWSLERPGNPWFRTPVLLDWIRAGIVFAARSSHPDGSCDDYYPFERASGAAAFSLFAILETLEITGIETDAEIDEFLRRRGLWLAAHKESGELSNHEALIVNCLARLGERFGRDRFAGAERERLARLLSWQSEEGWFSEYGGADLGYLSLTIGLLADLDRRRPELGLRPPIASAIRFLTNFVHPDGTVGGEYSSRNTLNFFPHGFEIAGAWMPEALAVNDLALRPLAEGRMPCFSDDRIIGHHLWSWLIAYREYRPERPAPLLPAPGQIWFEKAGLLIDRREDVALFTALRRGGVFKLYKGDRLLCSDTGPTLRTKTGRVAVSHLEGPGKTEISADHIETAGRMAWARGTRLTPPKNIILRGVMITLGRFFPDLVRRLLQRILVTGRKEAPYRFSRTFEWSGTSCTVIDQIEPDADWSDVQGAAIGGYQTSMTTVMARVFRLEQLQPWLDLTDRLRTLSGRAPLRIERRFPEEAGRCGS